jgi:DNA gyrase/topoisomerase IV subunit B
MKKEISADDIKTVSWDEHVRLRPQLYFEKCFHEQSLDSLPLEVLCHAFDEYFDGKCKKIEIAVAPGYFTVTYDAGISLKKSSGFSKAEMIMTQIWACKNQKKHIAVGEEFCRVGMATINAIAEQCELITVCGGKKGNFIFEKGRTISRSIKACKGENEFTRIMVKPDKTIFADFVFTTGGVNENLEEVRAKLKDLEIIVHDHHR